MTVQAVLLPLFVQVALTFVLLYWLAFLRGGAVRSGRVAVQDAALDDRIWPPRARQVANCFRNQFELPVLFYVVVILAIQTRQTDVLFVALAWVFVLTRVAHAVIHTGSNTVPLRGAAYGLGALVLTLMWVLFALGILVSSHPG